MESIERGKSLVNIVPRGNNVLIRMEFNVSLMALMSGKPEESSEEVVRSYVAGFGPLVKSLDLDEPIVFKVQQAYIDVVVDGNERSIKKLIKFYESLPKLELNQLMTNKETATVGVIQYGIFPEFQIPAHYQTII
jgi:hypothetical protein